MKGRQLFIKFQYCKKFDIYMYLTTYILRTMLYVSLKLILKAVFNVVSINQNC